MFEVETPRLILRPLVLSDAAELHRIYSAPKVLRTMPAMTFEETEEQIRRIERHWQKDGVSWWAMLDRKTGQLIGRAGINRIHDWPLEPEPMEVGWVLDPRFWGRSLATEAGLAGINYGFHHFDDAHIISITTPDNAASRRVMEKCGLTERGETDWHGYHMVWYAIERTTFEAHG
jgi:[ribosomal protein S5]-alanine N-acetyltransferase